jgi:uncharacterized membrane protein YeiH
MPVDELEVPLLLNLIAVGVGALVGTLRAGQEDDVDVVGMFVLALCLGFGGGLVRDFFLGNLPPAALRTPAYLVVVILAAIAGSLFLAYLGQLRRPLWVLDSLSLGLFAAVGTNAALLAGLTFLPAVLIGALASVGGTILADMLTARKSALLVSGPPGALAGLAGAITYALLYPHLDDVLVTVLAVVAAFAVRLTGPLLSFESPKPVREQLHLRDRLRTLWRRKGSST